MFAGCRIDGVAGRGGMGVVYAATELRLQRPVALKLIVADRTQDEEFRARFEHESRLAASIDHPNVIPVYGAGEEDGVPYLVMRLVRGTDLHRLLRREHQLEPARAARIVAQVAAGLDAAHARGLVHRDVKPANVLLDAGEHVYLTDFGLTRLTNADTRITESGRWLGTVDFASPEQLRGERCDARSDVYALACVLYAALTGGPPLQRATVPAAIHAALHDIPPRASSRGAPPPFDRVLARALAKDPADRYPSAGDLGRAALAAAAGEPVTETERTVARGTAAPDPGAATAVLQAADADDPGGARHEAHGIPAERDAANGTATAATVARHEAHGIHGEGDAAPGDGPTVARPGRQEPPHAPDPPRVDADAKAAPAARAVRVHGRRRRVPARAALAAAALAGLVAVTALAISGAGADRSPPAVEAVTDNEVRAAVEAFSGAYAEENARGLGRLLTRDVVRVLPSGSQRGRRAVVAQYAAQFRANRTSDYAVSDLQVRGGDAGRAQGTYTVHRRGAAPFGGGFVLGVVKERGRVRIRLIAATPT